ncbi:MAG: addiction module antidote protein [Granulosicoccus sp.]
MATTTEWDPSQHLETKEQMALYLEAALEDGDSGVISAALGDIARSKGMSAIAAATGLGRESLYKSLSETGNPELATVLKVVDALGLKLTAVPSDSDRAA